METLFNIFLIADIILGVILLYKVFDVFIFPFITDKFTKILDKNPKWVISQLENKYYGFSDIDFLIVRSPLGMLPRLRLSRDKKRLEFLMSEDTSTHEVEQMAQLALMGKIKLNYNLWFPDKSLYWLSVLCFMLDGGDITVVDKKKQETS